MSYEMPKRPVHIDSYENNGNLLNPSEKYVCIRLWLPEGAPAEVLSEDWPDGKEPNIDREPPSAVVELISAKLERAWIDTSREKKREIIAWCRQNAAMLDRQWVEELIRREERTIARAQRKIVQLQNEVDDEEDAPSCDHGIVFDEAAALGMRNRDVRERFPRLAGPCPKGCGIDGIVYASAAHYIFGGGSDWDSR
jgi:hypothetical protein